MNAEQRIKLLIGDLHVTIAALQAQVETLTEQNKTLTKAISEAESNVPDDR